MKMAILMLFSLLVVGLVSAKMHTSYYDGNIATLHEHPNGDRIVTSEWITNVPYWPHYPYRNVQTMDGNWFFGYSNDFNINTTIKPSEMIGLTPNITYVPSAFDVKLPGVEGPRGTAFYRANVTIQKGSDIMVYISACAFYCQLYFDGIYIGDHKAGGYQAFYYVIKSDNTDNTNHEIFIVSNNEYNFYSAPVYTGGDFYHYGGLNRNVLVHTLPTPNEYDNYMNQVFVNGYNIDKGMFYWYPYCMSSNIFQ